MKLVTRRLVCCFLVLCSICSSVVSVVGGESWRPPASRDTSHATWRHVNSCLLKLTTIVSTMTRFRFSFCLLVAVDFEIPRAAGLILHGIHASIGPEARVSFCVLNRFWWIDHRSRCVECCVLCVCACARARVLGRQAPCAGDTSGSGGTLLLNFTAAAVSVRSDFVSANCVHAHPSIYVVLRLLACRWGKREIDDD